MQTMLTVTVKEGYNESTKKDRWVINTNTDKYQRRTQ